MFWKNSIWRFKRLILINTLKDWNPKTSSPHPSETKKNCRLGWINYHYFHRNTGLVLEFGPCFWGLTFKNRGVCWGSRRISLGGLILLGAWWLKRCSKYRTRCSKGHTVFQFSMVEMCQRSMRVAQVRCDSVIANDFLREHILIEGQWFFHNLFHPHSKWDCPGGVLKCTCWPIPTDDIEGKGRLDSKARSAPRWIPSKEQLEQLFDTAKHDASLLNFSFVPWF